MESEEMTNLKEQRERERQMMEWALESTDQLTKKQKRALAVYLLTEE